MSKVIVITIVLILSQSKFAYCQWYPLNTQCTDNFNDHSYINVDTGFVISQQGNIFRTEDGGLSWNTIYSGNVPLTDMHMPGDEVGYIVGNDGILLKTINGGISWSYLNSGVTSVIRDVYFLNDTVGFYCGQSQIIARTTDGGFNWIIISYGPYWLRDFCFVNNDTGYCVGDGGRIMKTTDGGETWIEKSCLTTENLTGVDFPVSDIGYVCGKYGTILKTVDGGETWSQQQSGTSSFFIGICFLTPELGYVVGLDGVILKTINGGREWNPQPSGVTTRLSRICFPDSSTGYIAGYDGVILKTCDGPAAGFTYEIDGLTAYFTNTSSSSDSCWWNFGDGYFSSLCNPVHTYADTGFYNVCLIAIDSCGSDTTCQEIGIIYTGIKENNSGSLVVFPNPTTGEINISNPEMFQISWIKIYDLYGRVVKQYSVNDNNSLITINLDFDRGLYLLNVNHQNGSFNTGLIMSY